MNDAKKILKLIEKVNPKNSKALDEIDARFVCYLDGMIYVKHGRYEHHFFGKDLPQVGYKDPTADDKDFVDWYVWEDSTKAIEYTRSRDLLKESRPEGYKTFKITYTVDDKYICFCGREFKMIPLPTEELAELHAIIQAIQWERENNETN